MCVIAILVVYLIYAVSQKLKPKDVSYSMLYCNGGGPIHAHPQFSQRFVLFHGKDIYHIIGNYQIDHIHL